MKHGGKRLAVEVAAIEQVTPLIKMFTLRRPSGCRPARHFSGGQPCDRVHAGGRTERFATPIRCWARRRDPLLVQDRRAGATIEGAGVRCSCTSRFRLGTRLELRATPSIYFPLAKLCAATDPDRGGRGHYAHAGDDRRPGERGRLPGSCINGLSAGPTMLTSAGHCKWSTASRRASVRCLAGTAGLRFQIF